MKRGGKRNTTPLHIERDSKGEKGFNSRRSLHSIGAKKKVHTKRIPFALDALGFMSNHLGNGEMVESDLS